MNNPLDALSKIHSSPELTRFAVKLLTSLVCKSDEPKLHDYFLAVKDNTDIPMRVPHPLVNHVALCKYPLCDLVGNVTHNLTSSPILEYFGEYDHPWVNALVGALNESVTEQGEGTATVTEFDGDKIEFETSLKGALSLLSDHSPDSFCLVRSMISHIIIINGSSFVGSSSKLFLGASLINPSSHPTGAHLIDTLVHEASHIELYIRQFLEPFVIDNAFMLSSPLRTSARPAEAVLHATFVLGRTCIALAEIIKYHGVPYRNEYVELLNSNFGSFSEGLHTLSHPGLLTDRGHLMRREMMALRNDLSLCLN